LIFKLSYFLFFLLYVLMPDGHILSVLSESMQSTRGGIFNLLRIGSTKSPLLPSGTVTRVITNEALKCFPLLRTQLYRVRPVSCALQGAAGSLHCRFPRAHSYGTLKPAPRLVCGHCPPPCSPQGLSQGLLRTKHSSALHCYVHSSKGCGQFLALPVSACAHNNTINKACLIFKLSYFLFFLLYVLPDGRGLCPHAGRAHTFGLVRKYAKYARGDF